MKSALALLFLLSMSQGRTVMAQDRMSDEQRVRTLDNEERLAALKRDIPALERLWSDHLSVNAPNNQVVAGKQAVLDTFVRSGVINFATFERPNAVAPSSGIATAARRRSAAVAAATIR